MLALERTGGKKKPTIILANSENNKRGKTMFGYLVAAGPGRWQDGMVAPMVLTTPKISDVKKIIFFSEYDSNELVVDGEEYRAVREEHVFGIFEK